MYSIIYAVKYVNMQKATNSSRHIDMQVSANACFSVTIIGQRVSDINCCEEYLNVAYQFDIHWVYLCSHILSGNKCIMIIHSRKIIIRYIFIIKIIRIYSAT